MPATATFARNLAARSLLLAAVLMLSSNAALAESKSPERFADVVVYGGTAAGAVAAIQVARMGHSVILIEPGNHIGGLTSGGLGATDIGNKAAIGGVAREFYRRVGTHYSDPANWTWQKPEDYKSTRNKAGETEMWTFEPHVAEKILREMLDEAGVNVVMNSRLDLTDGVTKSDGQISSIRMEDGAVFDAKMFIDATYEGDLMAKAGVSYTIGREGFEVYGEDLNGVQLPSLSHQFKVPVDPYIVEGEPKSGLLPGISSADPGKPGESDHRVQAYNFRMCMTDVPENMTPWPKPAGYDPLRYELLLRYIKAGVWDAVDAIAHMPNRKTDTNNKGGFSTDNIGMNYEYPDGNYKTRQRIFEEHVTYQQGMMWFLANDPRVPEEVRADVTKWGLARDEFVDTGGWPHQLYVREARRMVSDLVMTQHHCQARETAEDAVGLGAYGMDSHNTQRYVLDGRVVNEGDVQVHGFRPYPVGFAAIVPRQSECTNLAVPVCLSASHIAFGSIRMEPVFMVLGQSAATAAVQAIEQNVAIQAIDRAKLQERLLADKQVLEWTGSIPPPPVTVAELVAERGGVVIDDRAAKFKGEWGRSSSSPGFVGHGYFHDFGEGQGEKSVTFDLPVEHDGVYEVLVYFTPNPNRATNTKVYVHSRQGALHRRIDQRKAQKVRAPHASLGKFKLFARGRNRVEITNEGADGHVIADAVQLVRVGE